MKFYKGDFLIMEDLICDGEDAGYSNRKEPEAVEKIKRSGKKFRMLDDDGIVYYHGLCLTDFGEEAFNPLNNFGIPNAGCTEIQYKSETGEWETM